MRTGPASVRDAGGLDCVDRAVHGYLSAGRDGRPDLRSYYDGLGDEARSASVLAALVKADLQRRFARGERPSAAEYLDAFPELRDDSDRVLSLAYEEFCLLEDCGSRPDRDAFCERYAPWKESLAWQLRCHRAISEAAGKLPPPPQFPRPGDTFEGFEILEELGRGGAARVYRARQPELGHRLVVLKVAPDRGNEAATLGRLEHPHITPVMSVTAPGPHRLRGLCMPYRPGVPLDEVVRRLKPARGPRPARAKALLDALRGPDGAGVNESAEGWRGFPARGTLADAAAWVAAALARALHHAHRKGVVHRDVKPANALLTFEAGPQLLDFNLADDPHSATEAEVAARGGTLPYMAPEQLAAFLDPSRWKDVGPRSDVYALGLLLRELLTGEAPEMPAVAVAPARAVRWMLDRRSVPQPDPRAACPHLPHALAAVVARCLRVDPADRYPDAAALAEDLERYLARRPLKTAHNPSVRERLGNRARRHARSLAAAAVLAGMVGAGAFALTRAPERWTTAPEARREFLDAARAVESGRADDAHPALARLAAEAPDSPVVHVYLAAAFRRLGWPEDAVARLDQAFRVPGADEALARWARTRPGFPDLALDTAELLLNFRDDGPEKGREGRADRRLDLASRVLKLLEARGAADLRGAEYRAVLAERRGAYAPAVGHIAAALDAPRLAGGADPDAVALLPLHHVAARAGNKWVRSLLARAGDAAPPAAESELARAGGLLRRSVEGLERGAAAFDRDADAGRRPAPSVEARFYRNFVLCEAKLTLGELENRAGRVAEAVRWFRECQDLIREMAPHGQKNAYFTDLRDRVFDRSHALAPVAGGQTPPRP